MSSERTVRNDPQLLATMLSDLRDADAQFHPTNYWATYEREFLPYLERAGVAGFRGRDDYGAARILASFGALDRVQGPLAFRRLDRLALFDLPGVRALVPPAARRKLQRLWAHSASLWLRDAPTLEEWRALCFAYARDAGRRAGAAPLDGLRVSLAGEPADVFEVDGGRYTSSTLYYYLRYAYVARHFDLNRAASLVELGSGSGKQAELVALLHPNLTLYLFDIPPQLYVAHQFLHAALPGRVVSYQVTRKLDRLPPAEPGRVFLMGSWQLPLIERERVDLFWSCATFGEMEPPVAANYLKFVNASASAVYLMQRMKGKKLAKRKGRRGVLERTTLEDYRRALASFELVDRTPARGSDAKPLPHYDDSFWRRTSMPS